ncbi:hypothetical protein Hanom_Chr07g00609471 [Helianthus anomalus]
MDDIMYKTKQFVLTKLYIVLCFPCTLFHYNIESSSDLNNATMSNKIRALIYKKYQRRIHHALIVLHSYRYPISL